ncbi:hypothetical protein TNCV_4001241 [Trichonephila clavipes]|uniref:Uncharacterized protein n=1 Tax=Trichonephila clavipes TaxID=2585209 RepID=A0A8X6RXP3_TRICX|nr:hypothetical protein TNCV_4001241 [Trichonephila clavipes]
MTATAGSDVVQSRRPIFDDFFQHLWPYIGNNTVNVVFQMICNVIEEVVDLPKQINLEVDSDDVQELLDSYNYKLRTDELIEMHGQEQDIEKLEADQRMVGNLTKGISLIEKRVTHKIFRKYGLRGRANFFSKTRNRKVISML